MARVTSAKENEGHDKDTAVRCIRCCGFGATLARAQNGFVADLVPYRGTGCFGLLRPLAGQLLVYVSKEAAAIIFMVMTFEVCRPRCVYMN